MKLKCIFNCDNWYNHFRSRQIRSGEGEGSEKSDRRHHRDAKEHRIPH